MSEFENTKAGKGAKTTEYYRVTNIPDRFNDPGNLIIFLYHSIDASLAINNQGNPVFSCSTKIDSGLATEKQQSTEGWLI